MKNKLDAAEMDKLKAMSRKIEDVEKAVMELKEWEWGPGDSKKCPQYFEHHLRP